MIMQARPQCWIHQVPLYQRKMPSHGLKQGLVGLPSVPQEALLTHKRRDDLGVQVHASLLPPRDIRRRQTGARGGRRGRQEPLNFCVAVWCQPQRLRVLEEGPRSLLPARVEPGPEMRPGDEALEKLTPARAAPELLVLRPAFGCEAIEERLLVERREQQGSQVIVRAEGEHATDACDRLRLGPRCQGASCRKGRFPYGREARGCGDGCSGQARGRHRCRCRRRRRT